MPSDACSGYCSPDSDNIEETDFDSAPTDQELSSRYVHQLHYVARASQVPNFVYKIAELRDCAADHS